MYDIATDESIKQAERTAIEWAVAKQLELDIRPICSGEIVFGRILALCKMVVLVSDLVSGIALKRRKQELP